MMLTSGITHNFQRRRSRHVLVIQPNDEQPCSNILDLLRVRPGYRIDKDILSHRDRLLPDSERPIARKWGLNFSHMFNIVLWWPGSARPLEDNNPLAP